MRRTASTVFVFAAILFLLFATSTAARAAAPVISQVNPHSGPIGGVLVIVGTGFGATQGSSSVTVNGTLASIIESWSATEIFAETPVGATTGNVIVTVGGVKSNGVKLTIVPAPSITKVSLSSGPIGTSITITGTNLDPFWAGGGAAASGVSFFPTGGCSFCGYIANPTSSSDTSIVVDVPPGATTGDVAVMWDDIDGTPATFTVTGTLAPVADAGLNDVVTLGSTARLDGTHSYDLNGLALTYQWSFSSIPSGSKAVLLNPATPLPTFVADVAGEYAV
jgi:hypothetical protein